MDNTKKMSAAFVADFTNCAPAGTLAWDAIRLSRRIEDKDITLPVRIEDFELAAEEMATEMLQDPELKSFLSTIARIYIARMVNGDG